MDQRLALLRQWVAGTLDLPVADIAPASADASFRRYFRLRLADGTTRIVMDAPPSQEDCRPFIRIAGWLGGLGLHVPQVLAADEARGFVLLSDLGTRTYLEALDGDSADALYGDALDALLVLQRDFTDPGGRLPPYDEDLLREELDLFTRWLLARHLGLELPAPVRRTMEAAFDALVANALDQPQVAVHRDYHSRNLMVSAPNPGILDFQDAVCGPLTYDLVSLLRDCYIRWPAERVAAWRDDYHRRAREAGLTTAGTDTFRRWFDLMGVQRHLKAAGIFARLWHRDGKPGYLPDVPRTLGYVVEAAREHEVLRGLGRFVEETVLPALETVPVPRERPA